MKTVLLVLICYFALPLFAQEGFKVYENGMIYTPATMNALLKATQGIDLKHKDCELKKVFYAPSQAVGDIVYLKAKDINPVLEDLKHNITLDNFLAKYPDASVRKNVSVVRTPDETGMNYTEFNADTGERFSVNEYDGGMENYRDTRNTWVYKLNYYPEDTSYSIHAWYFYEDFKSMPVKEKYASMMRYRKCLTQASYGAQKDDFMISDVVKMPKNWQFFSLSKKEKLFHDLDSKQIIGSCSQDKALYEYSFYIASLAAATSRWEVFLSAHFYLMNHNHPWRSDTLSYVRELEAIGIDVPRLLTGTLIETREPNFYSFYVSEAHFARSISKSMDRSEFETLLLSMICDEELDFYNRLNVYAQFQAYADYVKEPVEKVRLMEQLNIAAQSLPAPYRNNRSLPR